MSGGGAVKKRKQMRQQSEDSHALTHLTAKNDDALLDASKMKRLVEMKLSHLMHPVIIPN